MSETRPARHVLGKSPATTVLVIDEVDLENWGIGGLPVEEHRTCKPKD